MVFQGIPRDHIPLGSVNIYKTSLFCGQAQALKAIDLTKQFVINQVLHHSKDVNSNIRERTHTHTRAKNTILIITPPLTHTVARMRAHAGGTFPTSGSRHGTGQGGTAHVCTRSLCLAPQWEGLLVPLSATVPPKKSCLISLSRIHMWHCSIHRIWYETPVKTIAKGVGKTPWLHLSGHAMEYGGPTLWSRRRCSLKEVRRDR